MLRLIVVAVVVIVALVRGGSLRNFAQLRLRALVLVFGSLALQLLIFTPFMSRPLIPYATELLYVASMALLVAWVVLNRGVPGMALVTAGVLMNTLAIAANGGYMPVAPLAAQYAGRLEQYPADGPAVANNSLAAVEGVRLWFLTDIFPIPAGFPLATVYSLGDILLTVGVSIFCYCVMRGRLRPDSALASPDARPGAHGPAATTA